MTARVTPAMAARIAALAFVMLAIAATALQLRHGNHEPATSAATSATASADPFRTELIRCQELGEAGARDAACLRAWAENRRRFLKTSVRPKDHVPVEMFSSTANTTADPSAPSMPPKDQ